MQPSQSSNVVKLPPSPAPERCEATMKNRLRCPYSSKWSVLTEVGEFMVCGQHKRAVQDDPKTMAVERWP